MRSHLPAILGALCGVAIALALEFTPAGVFAQVGGGAGFNTGLPTAQGGGAEAGPFGATGNLVPPAVSSCGTSPAVRFGDVSFGVIVTGTGSPTSCTLTWQAVGQGGVAGASPRASVLGGCMVIGQTTPVTAITQDNASGLAWTFTGASSAVFVYYCPQP